MLPPEARAAHVLPVTLAAAGDRSWRVRWSAASKYEHVCQAFCGGPEGELWCGVVFWGVGAVCCQAFCGFEGEFG